MGTESWSLFLSWACRARSDSLGLAVFGTDDLLLEVSASTPGAPKGLSCVANGPGAVRGSTGNAKRIPNRFMSHQSAEAIRPALLRSKTHPLTSTKYWPTRRISMVVLRRLSWMRWDWQGWQA